MDRRKIYFSMSHYRLKAFQQSSFNVANFTDPLLFFLNEFTALPLLEDRFGKLLLIESIEVFLPLIILLLVHFSKIHNLFLLLLIEG